MRNIEFGGAGPGFLEVRVGPMGVFSADTGYHIEVKHGRLTRDVCAPKRTCVSLSRHTWGMVLDIWGGRRYRILRESTCAMGVVHAQRGATLSE